MSLNWTLLANVSRVMRYDGTNSAEIIAELEINPPVDNRELTINVDSEADGVLVVSGLGCYRNSVTHAIEITEWTGPTTINSGDFVRQDGSVNVSVQPQEQIGQTLAIVPEE